MYNNILVKDMSKSRNVNARECECFMACSQIDEIHVVTEARPTFDQEMETLRKENAALKGQIEEWKAKLVRVETEHGVPQINSPHDAAAKSHVKVAPPAPAAAAAASPTEEGETAMAAPGGKSGKKKGGKGGGGGGGGGDKKDDGPVDVGRLDMRVGLITTAKKHPDADSLGRSSTLTKSRRLNGD